MKKLYIYKDKKNDPKIGSVFELGGIPYKVKEIVEKEEGVLELCLEEELPLYSHGW